MIRRNRFTCVWCALNTSLLVAVICMRVFGVGS